MDLPPLHRSLPAADATPRLSILVPTFDRDVVPLCRELLADMAALPESARVELLVLIDGNPALAGQEAILDLARDAGLQAGLAPSPRNLGRAEARNTLARLARGAVLLFLDADSLPDAPGFVTRALDAAQDPSEVVCGGRTGQRCPPAPPDARLFERHSQKREWISAEERNRDPTATFLSANFMVGRDLFLANPFDDAFCGWGWEDSEWALRIGKLARIRHVENSISHMEHHRDADWASRLDRSAVNYRRLFELHPDSVRQHRLFKLIRLFRRLPLPGGLLHRAALAHGALPVDARLLALKLHQAQVYARTLPEL
jgi:glycosyltransferase involved in cell wall biosynthesis